MLAGKATTQGTSQVVSYIPDPLFGLSLPKDIPMGNQIGCTDSTTDYTNRTPVTFGENTQTGCTMWLTRPDFANANACDALRTRIFNIQTLTAQSIDRIAKFGNASVNDINDWIGIIASPPQLTGLV